MRNWPASISRQEGPSKKKGDVKGTVASYKAAAKLTPDDKNLKRRLEVADSAPSTSTRFDYLLSNKAVTTKQLKEASEISKKKQ